MTVGIRGFERGMAGLLLVLAGCWGNARGQEPSLAYITKRDGNFEIYRCDPLGETHTRLTNNPGMDWSPQWSQTQGGLIYYSTSATGTFSIRMMDLAGNPQPFDADDLDEFNVSPDGTRVLVGREIDGHQQLVLKERSTGNEQILTRFPCYNGRAKWSPDSRFVAFISDRDGRNEVYVLDLKTQFLSRLTNNETREKYLSWSPDGQWLAMTQQPTDGTEDIYILNLETGEQRRVTDNEFVDAEIAWSPAGDRIAFHSTRNGTDHLYTIGIDGSDEHQLTQVEAYHGEPVWIPASRK